VRREVFAALPKEHVSELTEMTEPQAKRLAVEILSTEANELASVLGNEEFLKTIPTVRHRVEIAIRTEMRRLRRIEQVLSP